MKKESKGVCAQYWCYPNITGARQAEGGQRLRSDSSVSGDVEWPVISVITVVYNRVKTLERCILSVLGQNYPALEYIIIDGGSTDGTLELIQKYEQQIAYYLSEPDQGIYDAMNKGLSLATGDYIGLLNSDDFYAPGFLQAARANFKPDSQEIIYGNVLRRDPRYQEQAQQYKVPEDLSKYAAAFSFINMGVQHNPFLVPRSIYDSIGPYSSEFQIASDHLWINTALQQGISFRYLSHPTVFFATGGLSASISSHSAIQEHQSVTVDLNFPALSEHDNERLFQSLHDNIHAFMVVIIDLLQKYPEMNTLVKTTTAYLRYLFDCTDIPLEDHLWGPLQEIERLTGQNLLNPLPQKVIEFAARVKEWNSQHSSNIWLEWAIAKYLVAIGQMQAVELRTAFDRILARYVGAEQICGYYRSRISLPLETVKPVQTGLLVSLTSVPARIHSVVLTIESILRGTLCPEKILLWLNREWDDEQDIPSELLAQQIKSSGILEIRFIPDLKSGIIPHIQAFPESILVTAEDQFIYPPEWLELLYQSYLREPENIHCHRAHAINFEGSGAPLPYSRWDRDITEDSRSSLAHFFKCAAGVLFPPGSLDSAVLRKDLYLWLSPDADDAWLNAMAVRQGTRTRLVPGHLLCGKREGPLGHFLPIPCSQEAQNNQYSPTDEQVSLVYNYFGLWKKLFDEHLTIDYLLARNEDKARRRGVGTAHRNTLGDFKTQVHHLKNNRWYRFGQLSRKRKLWTIAKVVSKKLRIYRILRPLAKVLQFTYNTVKSNNDST